MVNLEDENSKGKYWVSLFVNKNAAVYFDSFEIEYIPQEIWNKIKDKPITHKTFRIQDNKSIMCGFYLDMSWFITNKMWNRT